MNSRERMAQALSGALPNDRLPVIEWAEWWDQTLARWQVEEPDLPGGQEALAASFGLDPGVHYWVPIRSPGAPKAKAHGAPIAHSPAEYRREVLPYLFDESRLLEIRAFLRAHQAAHRAGEMFLWFTLEGFFWFPRTVMGIENHLYAFYDHPGWMMEINEALTSYYLRVLEVIYEVLRPEWMTFAEDLSYNHGPMIGKDTFDAFLLPYYRRLIPPIRAQGTRVLIDTDGDVEPLIPWLEEAGVQGVLPLERQAGVDVARVRKQYPGWLMIGGFDKTVMHLGEEAMRAEFERLLPTLRGGGYIPSVDHQTPPDVSVAQYRTYVRLLKEYAQKAVEA